MSATLRSMLGRAFRRTALPLACYYAVTLALPLANGAAYAGSAFVAHALVVLVMPPVLIGLACALHAAGRALLGLPNISSGRTTLIDRRPDAPHSRSRARRIIGRSALP